MGERVAIFNSRIYPVQGIEGACEGSASTLIVNGEKAVIRGDNVNENGGTGTVTEGNDDDVFYNGVSISRRGSWTQTHDPNYKSIIYTQHSPNVYIGVQRDGGMDDLTDKINFINNQKPPVLEAVYPSTNVQARSWRDRFDWRDAEDGLHPDSQYYVHQGEWCDTECWGNHKGIIIFPDIVRTESRGRRIAKIELYMVRNDTQGFYYEQPLYTYAHTLTSVNPPVPEGEPTLGAYGGVMYANDGLGWAINDAKWCTLPSMFNTMLSEGTTTGVAFYRAERDHYMHFDGRNIRFRITYG